MQPDSISTSTPTRVPYTNKQEFYSVFPELHQSTLNHVINDPFLNLEGAMYGLNIITAAKTFQDVPISDLAIMIEHLLPVYQDFGKYSSWVLDREKLMGRHWKLTVDEEYLCQVQTIMIEIGITDSSTQEQLLGTYLNYFLDVFIEKAISAINTNVEFTTKVISNNDEQILYYIGGNIIHKLSKRAANPSDKDILLSFLDANLKGAERCSKWTEKCDSGGSGLKYPSLQFQSFILTVEGEMRKVNLEKVGRDTLKLDRLLENLLDSPLVKIKWHALCTHTNSNEHILEKIIRLFTTIRGFAVARSERNKYAARLKGKPASKKPKKSLRKSLRTDLRT
jgi:hypothetical protein